VVLVAVIVVLAACGAGEQAAARATPAVEVSQISAWRLFIVMSELYPRLFVQ
jgi:hypothetical protein